MSISRSVSIWFGSSSTPVNYNFFLDKNYPRCLGLAIPVYNTSLLTSAKLYWKVLNFTFYLYLDQTFKLPTSFHFYPPPDAPRCSNKKPSAPLQTFLPLHQFIGYSSPPLSGIDAGKERNLQFRPFEMTYFISPNLLLNSSWRITFWIVEKRQQSISRKGTRNSLLYLQ